MDNIWTVYVILSSKHRLNMKKGGPSKNNLAGIVQDQLYASKRYESVTYSVHTKCIKPADMGLSNIILDDL